MIYFTAVGPLLTPAFVPLAEQFNVPLQRFTLGELDAQRLQHRKCQANIWFHHFLGCNGSCIVAIAFGSLLCNTLAVKIGRRPVYLITTLGLAVSCFWAAESTSFPSLAAARAIQGLCMGEFYWTCDIRRALLTFKAPFEALIPASVGDIWHVHERGFRMSIFNLGVLGGIVSHLMHAALQPANTVRRT